MKMIDRDGVKIEAHDVVQYVFRGRVCNSRVDSISGDRVHVWAPEPMQPMFISYAPGELKVVEKAVHDAFGNLVGIHMKAGTITNNNEVIRGEVVKIGKGMVKLLVDRHSKRDTTGSLTVWVPAHRLMLVIDDE